MGKRFWAGIGSRRTPDEFKPMMVNLASVMEYLGFILRSGGADGPDTWFELGVRDPSNKRIYLPWKGFNDHPSQLFGFDQEAEDLARRFHPAWEAIQYKRGVKALICRNSHQIIGHGEERVNSQIVVCYTPDGKASGGTGQALRIAETLGGIKIYNLYYPEVQTLINQLIREHLPMINP